MDMMHSHIPIFPYRMPARLYFCFCLNFFFHFVSFVLSSNEALFFALQCLSSLCRTIDISASTQLPSFVPNVRTPFALFYGLHNQPYVLHLHRNDLMNAQIYTQHTNFTYKKSGIIFISSVQWQTDAHIVC